jgi:IS5 family transposase
MIAALRSTKIEDASRDPEMHQTKKENPYHLVVKARIGLDAEFG